MPFHAMRSGAFALACPLAFAAGLTLVSAAAVAQDAPATAPAQAQPTGPVKVELQPSQADWTKVCGNAGPKRTICFTIRDFTQAPDQPPLIALAVYDVKGEDAIIRFLMPLTLLLQPGIRFQADKGSQQEGKYTFCLPNGCFAEARLKAAALDGMKKAATLSIVAKNQINAEVTFTLPITGFGKAFDGPAVDPKVLQQQQQAQQQELQKQLQERAKQQRQNLENGAAPAAPAPAAPAPAAPAPKP